MSLSSTFLNDDACHCPPRGVVMPRIGDLEEEGFDGGKFRAVGYIGLSRTTFSTLVSFTATLDKCSSAFTCAAII